MDSKNNHNLNGGNAKEKYGADLRLSSMFLVALSDEISKTAPHTLLALSRGPVSDPGPWGPYLFLPAVVFAVNARAPAL